MQAQLVTERNDAFLFPFNDDAVERNPMIEPPQARGDGPIKIARWTSGQMHRRTSIIDTPRHCFTIMIAVRPIEVDISSCGETILQGAMPSGTAFVASPGAVATLNFHSSFDLVCLQVAARFAEKNGIGTDLRSEIPRIFRDMVVETFVRALVDDGDRCGFFMQSVSHALAARCLNPEETDERGTPLPKWRLAKFERFISSRLHESVSLEQMAEAVDLSRMHFAKSFRLATGFTPHEYLLFRRIEWAKSAMLTSRMNLCEIALEAGFQAQAHFSTVFKRFTGATPAQWKIENQRPA